MDQFISKTAVVFAVHLLVEAIPHQLFRQLEQQLGRPAYHLKMILKIFLYAHTQKVFSGRRIEFLLEDSYWMRWLASHEQISYRTINRFPRQDCWWLSTGNKFKKIRKAYGAKSSFKRKNRDDFENNSQNRLCFL